MSSERYKKRYNRLKQKMDTEDQKPLKYKAPYKSPKSKFSGKALLLYSTIIDNIRHRYMKANNNREKRYIAGLVTRKRILKQYGLGMFANATLSISRRHLDLKPLRKPNVNTLRLKSKIIEFFPK